MIVEYWLYQSTGKGKINPEHIAKLDAIGFEWDPQRARWNIMYEKLLDFYHERGHCQVPKGYQDDTELANWVRNQRLEYANLQRGRKSRMSEDRIAKLNSIGFKWSTSHRSPMIEIAQPESQLQGSPPLPEQQQASSTATTSDASAASASPTPNPSATTTPAAKTTQYHEHHNMVGLMPKEDVEESPPPQE